MKVDDLYMENLLEYVFDDHLFVTYKFISVKLKVHVNLAKQMLYHFYDTEKAKGKKICATYYLSGMAPQKWISSLNTDDDEIGVNPAESYGDKDAYLVMLCKDHELEEMKRKFSRLYSVHVYGLSASSSHTLDMLNKALHEPLRDDDGNPPVHYGPISCKAAFEYKEDPRLAPILKNVQEVKASVALAKAKQDQMDLKTENKVSSNSVEVKSPVKNSKNERTTSVTKKPSATDSSNSEDKDRLKNMFAAAATRPKPKPNPEEVSKSASSSSKESKGASASSKESSRKPVSKKQDTVNKKSFKEKEATRKRKRIRDVFSSSDEEEAKMSDDEDGLPESPVPRKRQQIDSDSDDDFKPEVKKPPSPSPALSSSGKRRVSKTIQKRHVDEQGFLVTVMTQVMMSESDHSDEEDSKSEKVDKTSTTNNTTNNNKQKETVLDQNRNGLSAGTKTDLVSKKAPSGNPPKKQATLMSFFQKK